MEFLFVCCKLLKRGPRFQNLAWISTSQRAELIDSVVIVQLLSQSQLQNWHAVPGSDFDYFWTKSRMRLELGFYIMSLLSNILQMLSPEGGSTFQGAQTVLKQNCVSSPRFPSGASLGPEQQQALLAGGQELPAAPSLSRALERAVPNPIWVLFSLCHPAEPEPSTPNSTHASQGCRQASQNAYIMCLTANRPTGLWTSLCNPTTEATASNLGTNAQPCQSSSCQPCSRSWALTRDFPSIKTSEQSQPHSSKLWVQVMEKGKVGNLAFQAQCLFSGTVCDDGWMREITDLWVLIKQ